MPEVLDVNQLSAQEYKILVQKVIQECRSLATAYFSAASTIEEFDELFKRKFVSYQEVAWKKLHPISMQKERSISCTGAALLYVIWDQQKRSHSTGMFALNTFGPTSHVIALTPVNPMVLLQKAQAWDECERYARTGRSQTIVFSNYTETHTYGLAEKNRVPVYPAHLFQNVEEFVENRLRFYNIPEPYFRT